MSSIMKASRLEPQYEATAPIHTVITPIHRQTPYDPQNDRECQHPTLGTTFHSLQAMPRYHLTQMDPYLARLITPARAKVVTTMKTVLPDASRSRYANGMDAPPET